MTTQQELCTTIESLHPKMGACGVDFDVEYDDEVQAWSVDFHQGKQHLKTFVEDSEADDCLKKKQCIPLGLQMGQLRENFEKYIHEHALEKDL